MFIQIAQAVVLHNLFLAFIVYYFSDKSYFRLLLTFTVAMYSGRTQRDKDRLAEAVTENVVSILKVDKKDVIVVFQETPHGNWYASGIRL
jgi:4-oxalocrotonate tautomerase